MRNHELTVGLSLDSRSISPTLCLSHPPARPSSQPHSTPRDHAQRGGNPYNRWACLLGGKAVEGGSDGLWYPSEWPRDNMHLRCEAGRDAPMTDVVYRMSASPVFFAALFFTMIAFCARVVYVFLQRRQRRKVHCCAAAPPQASEWCPAGCCYCPAAPRWSAGDNTGVGSEQDGANTGIQLRQSLLYDNFDAMARDAIDGVDFSRVEEVPQVVTMESPQQLGVVPVITDERHHQDDLQDDEAIANADRPSFVCLRRTQQRMARVLQWLCFRPLRRCWSHRYCSPCRRTTTVVRHVLVRWWDPVLEPTCLLAGFLWGLFFILVACVSFPESVGVQIPKSLYDIKLAAAKRSAFNSSSFKGIFSSENSSSS